MDDHMWPRAGMNTHGSYDDPVLALKRLRYNSRVQVGPELISIGHLFAVPRSRDHSRVSFSTPFFLGLVEHEGTLWVVFELREDGPQLHTPRVARPITVEEEDALREHVRKHSSLAFFARRRDHVLKQVEVYWHMASEMLVSKIPPELELFARSWRWSKHDSEDWDLPLFLSQVWEASKKGEALRVPYMYDELAHYGIKTRSAALRAFRELEAAWAGMVSLRIDQDANSIKVDYWIPQSE